MRVVEACVWGLLGVVLIEAHALRSAVTAAGGVSWPWRTADGHRVVGGYAVAVVCRVVMGVGLNAVYAAAHQIDGPLAAVTMGIAAPLILQQMAAQRVEDTAPPQHIAKSAPVIGRTERVEQAAGGTDAY